MHNFYNIVFQKKFKSCPLTLFSEEKCLKYILLIIIDKLLYFNIITFMLQEASLKKIMWPLWKRANLRKIDILYPQDLEVQTFQNPPDMYHQNLKNQMKNKPKLSVESIRLRCDNKLDNGHELDLLQFRIWHWTITFNLLITWVNRSWPWSCVTDLLRDANNFGLHFMWTSMFCYL